MKRKFALRITMLCILVAAAVLLLLNVTVRTIGQSCGEIQDQCHVASIFVAYTNNLGSVIVEHEAAIEAFATIFVAVFTFTLWSSTEQLANMAAEQGKAMESSIAEAAKATEATNAIAKATRDNALLMEGILRKQMRAYVTVEPSSAVRQDTKAGIRFGATQRITNAGLTPAKNVSYQISAEILPVNLPDDFVFENLGDQYNNDATLIPRQGFSGFANVEKYLSESEVDDVMLPKPASVLLRVSYRNRLDFGVFLVNRLRHSNLAPWMPRLHL